MKTKKPDWLKGREFILLMVVLAIVSFMAYRYTVIVQTQLETEAITAQAKGEEKECYEFLGKNLCW